jgi:sodium-dependent dicarboxylate transporter 2/3/5
VADPDSRLSVTEGSATSSDPAQATTAALGSTFQWPRERRPTTPEPPTAIPAPRRVENVVQGAVLIAGTLGALWIYLAPLPAGLSPAGKTAFAVWLLCTTLWITNFVPFGVTGLLAVALLALTGAMTPAEAYAAFGSSAVFFLIGIFIIAGALIHSGLSKRCALWFLSKFERSPYAFANGMMLTAAFGTVWMPNQATTAMLFPIAVEVALALRLRPTQSNYAKTLFLSLAWGALIGANASFLGSARAALALGMLQQSYGLGISFSRWMLAGLPVVILGVLVTPLVLRLSFPREDVPFAAAREVMEHEVGMLGKLTRDHWITLLILLLTIGSWIAVGGRQIDLAVIALLGAVTLFAAGVLKWENIERHVHWNIVLMYGGAIALSVLVDKSGATKWLLDATLGDVHISPFVAIVGVGVVSLLLSEFMSNAAAVAAVLPIAFTLADRVGASPVAMCLATSFGAGLDFAFPISTAPNTIVFASGYLRTADFIKAGSIMTIACILILVIVIRYWWPMIGL